MDISYSSNEMSLSAQVWNNKNGSTTFMQYQKLVLFITEQLFPSSQER